MLVFNQEVLVGTDPELWLMDKNDKIISAHRDIPGTKSVPYSVPGGNAIQADGTAFEFNIAPATDASLFYARCGAVLDGLPRTVKGWPSGTKLLASPLVVYSEEDWKNIPESAKELGCSPDFSAYTLKTNPRPNPDKVHPRLRTAAGHIAIGWRAPPLLVEGDPASDAGHFETCATIVRVLDVIFAAFDDFFHPEPHLKALQAARQRLYGDYGAFRPKPYGLEYRTPSNTWLRNENTMRTAYSLTMLGYSLVRFGFDASDPKKMAKLYQQMADAAIMWKDNCYATTPVNHHAIMAAAKKRGVIKYDNYQGRYVYSIEKSTRDITLSPRFNYSDPRNNVLQFSAHTSSHSVYIDLNNFNKLGGAADHRVVLPTLKQAEEWLGQLNLS